MDIWGIVLWAVLTAANADQSHSLCTDRIIIGVVADVNVTKHDMLSLTFDGYNVTFVWISVDTDEIYHVYNAVQQLDTDPSVDVIVHADVSQASLRLSYLLKTRQKSLILWGMKRKQSVSIDKDESCAGENTTMASNGSSKLQCAARTDEPSERNMAVNDSYNDVVPGSVMKLLLRLKWNYVIVIHDTESEHDVSKVIDQLSTNKIMMIVINIDNAAKVEDVIFKLHQDYAKNAKMLHFLVVCRYQCARKVIRMANTFDDESSTRKQKTFLEMFSMWLFVLYGYEDWMSRSIRACGSDIDNVAIVAIPEWQGGTIQTLALAVESMVLRMRQMQFDGSLNTTTWKDSLINKLIQVAASRHPSVYCRGFNIDTLLWAANTKRAFTNVGYIDMSGQIIATSDIFPNVKYGYNKRTFLVSTLDWEPFVMSNTSANGTKSYYGLGIDIFHELSVTLNFTYVLTEPADGKWGTYEDPEKEIYNGLVGQLQRMEVDMVAAPLVVQRERARQMDFTYPFFFEFSTIVVKRTDPMERKWRTLINPFKWEVHVSIAVSLFVVTSLLWISEKWNPFYQTEQNAQVRQQDGGLHYWHNSFWYMYGALLCQGGIHLPDSVAGRTFVSCWWLFCIIVVGTYCGNLIAFLTVTKDKPPFSTLQELVDRKDEYKWGVVGGTFWETVFIHSSIVPLFKDVGRGLVEFNQTDPSVLALSVAEHIKKVAEGGYAWIGDKTSMDFAISTECDIATSTDKFLPMSYAFGFQKNSPHTIIFAAEMLKIQESGLLKIWKRKWWPKLSFCQNDGIVSASQPITLPDVQSAFYVCVAGICLSICALLLEIIVFRYKTYKRKMARQCTQSPTDSNQSSSQI